MDLLRIILDGVLIAALIVLALLARTYLPSYLRKKGENLATKEDIEEITQGIEGVKSGSEGAVTTVTGKVEWENIDGFKVIIDDTYYSIWKSSR